MFSSLTQQQFRSSMLRRVVVAATGCSPTTMGGGTSVVAATGGGATTRVGAVRFLNVHEYVSMEIMQSHGIQTPACKVASTPEEAEDLYLNVLNTRTFFYIYIYIYHLSSTPKQ